MLTILAQQTLYQSEYLVQTSDSRGQIKCKSKYCHLPEVTIKLQTLSFQCSVFKIKLISETFFTDISDFHLYMAGCPNIDSL